MLKTVRSRILFFSCLSVFALSALAALSWTIITRAETAAEQLIQNNLTESWLLEDLERDHRRLQDLAYKVKAQLLLWSEITEEFEALSKSLPGHWQAISRNPLLKGWTEENEPVFQGVLELLDAMKPGIEENSYYRVGQVVDFKLFPALEPMLEAIRQRKEASRERIDADSAELLTFLESQQVSLVIGSVAFLLAVVLITLWLRRSVIGRLQRIETDVRRIEASSDLTNLPAITGQDEVAGVSSALTGLLGRFEQFIGDIRVASHSVNERSASLDSQAEGVKDASDKTRRQIQDVSQSMAAIAEQASAIEAAIENSAATVREAVCANLKIQFGKLEAHSVNIGDAVRLQRDEIGRVGRRSRVLDESADILISSVDSTRAISEALRQQYFSMRQLTARFRTTAESIAD